MNAKLTLLIIEDDPDHVVLLKRSLSAIEGLSLETYHAPDLDRARLVLEDHCIDAIFLDYRIGPDTTLDFLRELRAEGDLRPVVVITAHGDEYVAVEMMGAGADDYISKRDLKSPTLTTIMGRVVARVSQLQVQNQTHDTVKKRLALLTPREREVLERMMEGKTTPEIARALFRSENTVKIHRSHILHKMRANTTTELIRIVMASAAGTSDAIAR